MADNKQKKQFAPATDTPETLKDGGVARDLTEVPMSIVGSALEQIDLKNRKPLSGEINLAKTNEKVDQKANAVDAHLRQLQRVQRQETEVFNRQKKDLEVKIAQIMQELHVEVARLEQQTAELTGEAKNITMEAVPKNAGAYHLNFFEWIIGSLKDIRKRVSESRMWLNLWNRKKKQKGYWAMFKKHGTSFAMSEERAIASANG